MTVIQQAGRQIYITRKMDDEKIENQLINCNARVLISFNLNTAIRIKLRDSN